MTAQARAGSTLAGGVAAKISEAAGKGEIHSKTE